MDNKMFCPMMQYMQWEPSPMHPMHPQWGMSPMQSMQPPMHQPMQWEPSPMQFMDYDMHDEDERDEEYFKDMYPESCKRISPYVDKELDRMEGEESPLYDEYIDSKMLEKMGDKICDRVISDMPDMAEEVEDRQFGRRRILRDLVGVLLFSNLLRRRRRRRRRRHDYDFDYYY